MDNLRLTSKAQGEAYEKLRDSLSLVESSNRPGAHQEFSSAKGLFQFTKAWDSWSQEQTGRTLASFLPKDNSPEELERSGREQREILFPAYYEKEVAPFVKRIRREGLAKDQTDIEIAATFHFAGGGAAHKFFAKGTDATINTAGNKGIPAYQAAVRRNLGKDVGAFRPEPSKQRVATLRTKKTPAAIAAAPVRSLVTSSYSRGTVSAAAITMTPESMAELNRTTLDGLERLAMELRERSA